MTLDDEMCKLIADLEYLVGSECYNPKSYDGWKDVEGCAYRYPVCIPDERGEYTKTKYRIRTELSYDNKDLTPKIISNIKYRFGANELYIGRGIINILDRLERRYGIDFNELESKVQSDKTK